MEWLVHILCLVLGGGAGSLLTFLHLRKKAQKAPRFRPLQNVRVALNMTGSHAWLFAHELEERIFARGGRVVALPAGWRPEKAASMKQTDSTMTFPDLVIEGQAVANNIANVGFRIYTSHGEQIGTFRKQHGEGGSWSFLPLCDAGVRACEEAIIRWQRQQPYDMLELELKEEKIQAESREAAAQLRQM